MGARVFCFFVCWFVFVVEEDLVGKTRTAKKDKRVKGEKLQAQSTLDHLMLHLKKSSKSKC